MNNANLFTPRLVNTDERLRMTLTAEDMAKVGRGKPWQALVTDQETGKRWHAKGASCGAVCFCDAIVEEVPECRHPLPRLLVEFPGYPVATLPPIPEHWEDASWHNDAAPFFIINPSLGIWIDYPEPSQRESGDDVCRFCVVRLKDGQHLTDLTDPTVGQDDDWFGILAQVLADEFARQLSDALDPPQFDEVRRRNRTYPDGTCASHDLCDANMVMAPAFEAIVGREPDVASDADAGLWSLAWGVAKERHLTASDDEAGAQPAKALPYAPPPALPSRD